MRLALEMVTGPLGVRLVHFDDEAMTMKRFIEEFAAPSMYAYLEDQAPGPVTFEMRGVLREDEDADAGTQEAGTGMATGAGGAHQGACA